MIKERAFCLCPICQNNKYTILINLNCGNIDDSPLYQYAKIVCCDKCGHVFNELSENDIKNLDNYYNKESSLINSSASDDTGYRPGSSNKYSVERYEQLYSLISNFISKEVRVLDVGCGKGGFLEFLFKRGTEKLFGIDITENYISESKKNNHIKTKIGNAVAIPYEDNSFDLLIIDQVIEHLFEPQKAFQEAKRVLSEGGILCVGVPDSARYYENYFFDFYWLTLREHIQHFDMEHLTMLAESEGFELIENNKNAFTVMSEKMILPNIDFIFRLKKSSGTLNISDQSKLLKNEIIKYIETDKKKFKEKNDIIEAIYLSKKPVYIWGIGKEFMFLYENTNLDKCNIQNLIDANPYKQQHLKIGGMQISDNSILAKASSNSLILITAVAHSIIIKETLKQIGYNGEVIEF